MQCINGVSSNSVEGRTKICQLKDLILSLYGLIVRRIYIYILDCHVCGSQYVEDSVQTFNKRMNGHRSDLTKKTLLSVSQHFVSPGHSLDDFGRSKIYIIDHNPSWKENQRQKREIRELRTLHPEGINEKA